MQRRRENNTYNNKDRGALPCVLVTLIQSTRAIVEIHKKTEEEVKKQQHRIIIIHGTAQLCTVQELIHDTRALCFALIESLLSRAGAQAPASHQIFIFRCVSEFCVVVFYSPSASTESLSKSMNERNATETNSTLSNVWPNAMFGNHKSTKTTTTTKYDHLFLRIL